MLEPILAKLAKSHLKVAPESTEACLELMLTKLVNQCLKVAFESS